MLLCFSSLRFIASPPPWNVSLTHSFIWLRIRVPSLKVCLVFISSDGRTREKIPFSYSFQTLNLCQLIADASCLSGPNQKPKFLTCLGSFKDHTIQPNRSVTTRDFSNSHRNWSSALSYYSKAIYIVDNNLKQNDIPRAVPARNWERERVYFSLWLTLPLFKLLAIRVSLLTSCYLLLHRW